MTRSARGTAVQVLGCPATERLVGKSVLAWRQASQMPFFHRGALSLSRNGNRPSPDNLFPFSV
jgi:hypothetical protein